tara:strand:- start:750 stop:1742 length:993 start_codon:yes stop_codon:yes gene_type:complete
MTDYKTLKGIKIKTVASDPPAAVGEGQMWYNSAATDYKTSVIVESWTAGGNINTNRSSMGGTKQGTENAALVFGGHTNPAMMTQTESYDGTSWTEVNDLPAGKQLPGGAGTTAAALAFGGSKPPPPPLEHNSTEEWDGTNWTSGGDMNEAKYMHNSNAGTATAALAFGGPGGNNTEEYNGSSWSEQNNMSAGKSDMCGFGTQTAAVGHGGTSPNFAHAEAEEYDGTSWSTTNSMNQVNRRQGGGGSQTAGLAFGGLIASGNVTNKAEYYNGTSWSVAPTLGTGRYYVGNSGATQGACMLVAGLTTGSATSYTVASEEFTQAATVKVITDS